MYLGVRCTFGLTRERHRLRQESFEVRQVGIQRQLQVEQHIFLDVADGSFGFELRFPEVRLELMQRHDGHRAVAVGAFGRSIQCNVAL